MTADHELRRAERAATGDEERYLALARRAATHVLAYPFRVWGFGEDIALRALLELGDATGDRGYRCAVRRLVDGWCDGRGALEPRDHVSPGVVLLELFERTGDGRYLGAGLELGRLLSAFPRFRGVRVHRRDLAGLSGLIWVDCMALDGPFLARLATVTGDAAWRSEAVDAARSYARVLQDDADGLFVHGFDVGRARPSPCRWARGNGWALHGLVDTLEMLPPGTPGAEDLLVRLTALATALPPLQDASGLWHTVLDDATTPLEASTAALFASGLAKARRLSLVPADHVGHVGAAIELALVALHGLVRGDGGLAVSSATPVGARDTYARQPLGIFPWGQGPLVLALLEAHRAAVGPAS